MKYTKHFVTKHTLDKFVSRYPKTVHQFEANITPIEDLFSNLEKGLNIPENPRVPTTNLFLRDGSNLVGVAGFVYLSKKDKDRMKLKFREASVELRNVFVLPKYRGKGLCGVLVKEVVRYLTKKQLAKRVKLDVFEENVPAIKCYTRAGFHEYTSSPSANKWLWLAGCHGLNYW